MATNGDRRDNHGVRYVAAALAALAVAVPTLASATTSTAVLVKLARTGGFAPADERIVVYRDGRGVGDGRRFQLMPRRLAALKDALARARFRTLDRTYGDPCCAKIAYSVTYAGRKVTTYERSAAPLRLRRVVDLLVPLAGARP